MAQGSRIGRALVATFQRTAPAAGSSPFVVHGPALVVKRTSGEPEVSVFTSGRDVQGQVLLVVAAPVVGRTA